MDCGALKAPFFLFCLTVSGTGFSFLSLRYDVVSINLIERVISRRAVATAVVSPLGR